MLVEHERHGETTYASETTEQMDLDPKEPDSSDILSYTDTRPMAGMYLYNAKHKQLVRDQVDQITAYQQDSVADAQEASRLEREGNRVPGR